MKKILYLIPLFLLFLIPKVYALPNCGSISSATLYDINSSTNVSSITTNKTTGSSLLCSNAWYTGASSNSSLGLGWEIKLAELNNKDFYYQINAYYHMENVGGGTPNIIASPHNNNYIALGTSNAANLWASGNYRVSDFSYTINTYSIDNSYTYFVVSYIFKANNNFNRIFLPFATSYTWTGSFFLSGIEITNIGSKSLSSTDINNLLSNQSTKIESDLNNVESNINSNIDNMESNVNSNIDNMESNVNSNIDEMESNVNSNIDEMEDGIKGSINNVLGDCHPSRNLYSGPNPLTVDTSAKVNVSLEPGTYTLSVDSISSDSPANKYHIALNDSTGTQLLVFLPKYEKYITFTLDKPTTIIGFWSGDYWDQSDDYITTFNNIMLVEGSKKLPYEKYGEEVCSSKIDQTNEQLNDLNNSINNSDSSGATDSASGFFENFKDDDFGLSGIITAPLNTIKTITSNTCTPLNLTIPFVDKEMSLPCMTSIYERHFGDFLDIYQIITFGIISYWVCVQIYAMVKGFKNPDKDEIEVMDL